jgi:adenine-specific DNA-methyltransferase
LNAQPEKLDGTSLDISSENRARLKQLFPAVFTETKNGKGELVESIDFERLKAELGKFSDVFESRKERYGMDWPGKKEALKLIQAQSYATLKPCREESVNFDTTENLFIEGDNLEVLKLLQKSYYGKVKMMYFDPPYNTGKEFIYPDNYSESLETYLEYAGLMDGDGKKFSTNTANEGRFHTKWLNMMYPRLYLARNLLRDDGVIFISIGAEELHNLINLMNEIFGEECQKNLIVIRRGIKSVQAQFETIDSFNRGHEYIVFYSKNVDYRFEKCYVPYDKNLEDEDCINEGSWNNHWRGTDRPTMRYEIFGIKPKTGQWRWGEDRSKNAILNWDKLCNEVGKHSSQVDIDKWVSDKEQVSSVKYDLLRLSSTGKPEHYIRPGEGKLASDLWLDIKPNGSSQLKKVMEKKYFDTPKSVDLLSRVIDFFCANSDIILDIFAGSATTAHAVLDLNRQDKGTRKFILVQLPEPCAPDSEAFKAGYKTIADIGKERIRRVIKKLSTDNADETQIKKGDKIQSTLFSSENLRESVQSADNLGFKVFKLDKSNFKQWQKLEPTTAPEQIVEQLELHIDHINHKATPEDLLYEILLKSGFMPTEKVETKTFAGQKVFSVADGALLLCLEESVSKELIDAVANAEPMQFICLDSAFHGNDQLKANAVQTFAARNMQKEKHNQIIFKTV